MNVDYQSFCLALCPEFARFMLELNKRHIPHDNYIDLTALTYGCFFQTKSLQSRILP